MAAIVGTKIGMTQVFTEDGTRVPVTVIEADAEHGHRGARAPIATATPRSRSPRSRSTS